MKHRLDFSEFSRGDGFWDHIDDLMSKILRFVCQGQLRFNPLQRVFK